MYIDHHGAFRKRRKSYCILQHSKLSWEVKKDLVIKSLFFWKNAGGFCISCNLTNLNLWDLLDSTSNYFPIRGFCTLPGRNVMSSHMEMVLGCDKGRGRKYNTNVQRPSSYNGKALNWFHQHRKCKAHKNPVWMKGLNCLSLQRSFWERVQNKEYSFTLYLYQHLGIEVQISFITNTHSTFTDSLPWYNFLFTLFCVLYNNFVSKDFQNWKIKTPGFFCK